MELRHLRYFVAVAEELHFGRAAQRLDMSQPPLSQQIQTLEKELGVLLLTRNKKQVVLTDAGRAFLAEARGILAQSTRAMDIAQRAARGEDGLLRIGFTGSIAYTKIMPTIIHQFHRQYPGVELYLQELHSRQQISDILEDRLDLGFVRTANFNKTSLEIISLTKERLVVVVEASHPLATLKTVSIRKLKNEPFIGYASNLKSEIGQKITSICLKAGFVPQIVQEATEMPTMIGLVATGLGLSIVSEAMCQLKLPNIVYLPLKEQDAQTEVSLTWRSERTSIAAFNFYSLASSIVHKKNA